MADSCSPTIRWLVARWGVFFSSRQTDLALRQVRRFNTCVATSRAVEEREAAPQGVRAFVLALRIRERVIKRSRRRLKGVSKRN